MPYCVAADVRRIIQTPLLDPDLMDIITISDAIINKKIGAQATGDLIAKKLSMLLTAVTIKTRTPQSMSIGEYSENYGNVLDAWRQEIDDLYATLGSIAFVSYTEPEE